MYDFPFAKEADRVGNVTVVAEAQDVIVGQPRLLLGGKVFRKVGNGVAGGLGVRRGERLAAGRNGVDARGVVHEIGRKAAFLNLFGREVSCKLVNYRRNYFLMCQLLRSYLTSVIVYDIIGVTTYKRRITYGNHQRVQRYY